MRYTEAITYLHSFIDYEKVSDYSYARSFKRERMRHFLAALGNPHDNLTIIHVAGSKGKGSVCVFIASILQAAGSTVGLFTSPHLNDFRERIRILRRRKKARDRDQDFEGMISKYKLCALIEKLKPAIERFKRDSRYGILSFFEVYTALALCYFEEQKVNFLVLETGIGGRLDATNVTSALLCVITPISHEHTKWLGSSLKDIAYEKASIIKKHNKESSDGYRIALTAEQDKAARTVIEAIAKRNHTRLLQAGRHFSFSIQKHGLFHYRGWGYELKNLRINLAGEHQIANASLAVASCQALKFHAITIRAQAIRSGLQSCRWPARFEIISKKPTIILDGAQNQASMYALHKTLTQRFPHKPPWLIFGIAKDKEIGDTCRAVSRISKQIILTKACNPRAMTPQRLLRYFPKFLPVVSESVHEALGLAVSKISNNDCIVITGSLYVCAEARKIVATNKPRVRILGC